MAARENTLKRRIRSAGGRLIRRAGLLPGGIPDGLGDDDRLAGTSLDGEVIMHFADTLDSLYQLRGWYGPLEALHDAQGVTIVCMDSRTARAIREETGIPVVTVARDATFDELVARSGTKLILYVNYNPLNGTALRNRSVIHVSLLHGDSDKAVSVSNQAKAYDFSFVAGQAAVDRYERYTALFDAQSRCIPVGLPARDTAREPREASGVGDGRPVVLYAPTWEGGQSSVAYSSLVSHGEALVRSLLAAGLHVLYRPHPLTGVRRAEFGTADAALRAILGSAGATVSEGRTLEQDFAASDLLIGDVSAVASDYLLTGKPMVITRSSEPDVQEAATALLSAVPRLTAADARTAGDLARELITEDPRRAARLELAAYYFGDTTPGASLARFLEACRTLSDRRDREWSRITAADRKQEAGA